MWQLIPKCFPKMGAPAQPLLGQTELIWCAQLPGQLQDLHSLQYLSSEQLPALPRRCCNASAATFHIRVCFAVSLQVEYLLSLAHDLWLKDWAGEGEGAKFGVDCQGKWGPKELQVRQKMSGLSCLEVCNYNLMSDCTQFGIQKLSASEAGNAGGASLPPGVTLGHPPPRGFQEGRPVPHISKAVK